MTVTFSIVQHAKNATLNSYDVVAVRPGTARVCETVIGSGAVDIISLDMCARLPFVVRRPLVRWACISLLGACLTRWPV